MIFRPVLSFFLILSVSFGFAQEGDSLITNIDEISISDLSEKSLEAYEFIQQIEKQLKDRSELDSAIVREARLDSSLTLFLNRVDTSNKKLSVVTNALMNLNNFSLEIDRQLNPLSARNSRFEDFRKRIRLEMQVWEVSKASAVKDEAPENAIGTYENVLMDFDSVDKVLQERMNEILEVQSGLNQNKRRIGKINNKLKEYETILSRNAFVLDDVPLYRLSSDKLIQENLSISIEENLQIIKNEVRIFYQRNKGPLTTHIFLFLFTLIVVFYTRRRQKKLLEETQLRELKILARHPFILSVLLSIMLIAPPYENTPDLIVNFLIVVSFSLVLFVFYRHMHRAVRPGLIAVGVILFLNPVYLILPDLGLVGRIGLILLSLIGIYLLSMSLRVKAGKLNFFNIQLGQILYSFLPLSFILLIGSIISNTIGAVSFARLLEYNVVRSIGLGYAFFGGAVLANGLIRVILANKPVNTFYAVSEHGRVIEKRIKQLLQWLFFYYWLRLSLAGFGLWSDFQNWFWQIMELTFVVGRVKIDVGGILAAVVTILVSYAVAVVVKFALEKELFRRLEMPRGIPKTISISTYFVILLLGFIMAVSQLGIDLDQISIIIGALGVGIGFGLQNIISNFVSGVVLIYERPIQEGDKVQIGTMMGTVKSIGLRASKVLTFDGSEVIVPNNNLIANEVINWTLSDYKRRATLEISVDYDSDIEEVTEILKLVVKDHPKIMTDPAPYVIFKGASEGTLEFRLHFWTLFGDGYRTRSEIAVKMFTELRKAGIVIPYPKREIIFAKEESDLTESLKAHRKTKKDSKDETTE